MELRVIVEDVDHNGELVGQLTWAMKKREYIFLMVHPKGRNNGMVDG